MAKTKKPKSKPKPSKKKVPKKEEKLKVLRLKCENCGEEEETILRCRHCDGTSVTAEIVVREPDQVLDANAQEDDTEEEENKELTPEEKEFDNIVAEGGLSEIFPGGGDANEGDDDSDSSGMSMDDVVDILDQE